MPSTSPFDPRTHAGSTTPAQHETRESTAPEPGIMGETPRSGSPARGRSSRRAASIPRDELRAESRQGPPSVGAAPHDVSNSLQTPQGQRSQTPQGQRSPVITRKPVTQPEDKKLEPVVNTRELSPVQALLDSPGVAGFSKLTNELEGVARTKGSMNATRRTAPWVAVATLAVQVAGMAGAFGTGGASFGAAIGINVGIVAGMSIITGLVTWFGRKRFTQEVGSAKSDAFVKQYEAMRAQLLENPELLDNADFYKTWKKASRLHRYITTPLWKKIVIEPQQAYGSAFVKGFNGMFKPFGKDPLEGFDKTYRLWTAEREVGQEQRAAEKAEQKRLAAQQAAEKQPADDEEAKAAATQAAQAQAAQTQAEQAAQAQAEQAAQAQAEQAAQAQAEQAAQAQAAQAAYAQAEQDRAAQAAQTQAASRNHQTAARSEQNPYGHQDVEFVDDISDEEVEEIDRTNPFSPNFNPDVLNQRFEHLMQAHGQESRPLDDDDSTDAPFHDARSHGTRPAEVSQDNVDETEGDSPTPARRD